MKRKVRLPKKWDRPRAGEWVQPVNKGYLFKCCGCGLIHSTDFRVHRGHIQFRCYLVTPVK